MAYLRWGSLFERRGGCLDPEVAAALARSLEEEYVGKRKLFLRILPNAFAGTPRAAVIQAAFGRFTSEPLLAGNSYKTFIVDLTRSVEDIRRKLDPKWRNELSGSEKNHLKVIAGCGTDEYRAFCLMYNQMRKRKSFETTVDVDEFDRIQQDLAEPHRMRVLICEDKGVVVARPVASAMGDTSVYLLGATSDDGLKSIGAYLLRRTLIKWLKENGFKWYDLGGIDPERNPGVYHFKRGFSGIDVTQMNPLVGCDSAVSSAIATAGLGMHRTIRGLDEGWHVQWEIDPPRQESEAL